MPHIRKNPGLNFRAGELSVQLSFGGFFLIPSRIKLKYYLLEGRENFPTLSDEIFLSGAQNPLQLGESINALRMENKSCFSEEIMLWLYYATVQAVFRYNCHFLHGHPNNDAVM
jgi:hypothetical protein